MLQFRWCLLPLTLLLFCLPVDAGGAEPLRINTSIKPPFSTEEENGFFDRLVREAFARIARQVRFVRLPTERSLQSVNSAASDGDLPRIAGLEDTYANLVRVDEPVIIYAFSAFSNGADCAGLGWDGLKAKRVGIVIGWKIYETSTPAAALRTMFTEPAAMLRSLDAGRIDLALYERYAGRHLAAALGLAQITECLPPLAEKPMYLYLHKDHGALVAPLQAALKAMKEDGSYARISRETLGTGH